MGRGGAGFTPDATCTKRRSQSRCQPGSVHTVRITPRLLGKVRLDSHRTGHVLRPQVIPKGSPLAHFRCILLPQSRASKSWGAANENLGTSFSREIGVETSSGHGFKKFLSATHTRVKMVFLTNLVMENADLVSFRPNLKQN